MTKCLMALNSLPVSEYAKKVSAVVYTGLTENVQRHQEQSLNLTRKVLGYYRDVQPNLGL